MPDPDVLLLAVLNSTPLVDGAPTDELVGSAGRERLRSLGGSGTTQELESVRAARDAVQGIVRGQEDNLDLVRSALAGVVQVAVVTTGGVSWEIKAPPATELAVRVILAWSDVAQRLPGRLRPCGNDECQLFLIDHSRPGTARWCSMATCGNRMKARAHAQRQRG